MALLEWADIEALPSPVKGRLIQYGPADHQRMEMFVPEEWSAAAGPLAAVVILHGGCWRAKYDGDYTRPFARAVADHCHVAAINVEYTRCGMMPDGGWPGTFRDVDRALQKIKADSAALGIAAGHVLVCGHSAGGHLAAWAATMQALPADCELLHGGGPRVQVTGALVLAGICDLASYEQGWKRDTCNEMVPVLMGGSPSEVPERYVMADPFMLPTPPCPVWLVHCADDSTVPVTQSTDYGKKHGATVHVVPGEHFNPCVPRDDNEAWTTVVGIITKWRNEKRTGGSS